MPATRRSAERDNSPNNGDGAHKSADIDVRGNGDGVKTSEKSPCEELQAEEKQYDDYDDWWIFAFHKTVQSDDVDVESLSSIICGDDEDCETSD